MSNAAISIENVSKSYQLGTIGTGTFRGDVQRWWARMRGLPDPHLIVGEKARDNPRDGEMIWALKDITFQVQQGEALGIIGRNGAGKSTLLKILSRVTAPTSGEIKVKGRIASLLEVGTGFHPELTGRENIYLNGAILGMKKVEITRKFDEIVDFSGVGQFIDTPVKRYSSGMYVRLAFAVAAHLEPEILVVDEVLAVGDAEFQKKCLGKMGDVAHEGRTVLFVSHQMEAILSLCTKASLFHNGTLILDGAPTTVVDHYLKNTIGQLTETQLGKRLDRRGSGDFLFQKVWFTNQYGNAVELCKPGEPINIHLNIIPSTYITSPVKVICGIGFHDIKGIRLFTLSNELLAKTIYLKGETDIVWSLDELPLCEGDYRCNLFLAGGNTDTVIDWIQDAFILVVSQGDYFGTGKNANSQGDRFYMRQRLQVIEGDTKE